MLMDGAIVMAVGMGSVFVFLGLMVLLMTILAKIMQSFPEELPADDSSEENTVVSNREDIAVVIAAVKAHMKGSRK